MTEEFKSVISLVVDGFKHSAREAQQSVKDIQQELDNTNKKSGNIGNSVAGGVTQGIKALLKYGFAIRSLFALANKVKSFTAEGIKNLVQFSSSTNAAISSMLSSLTQLKNSFATAFAPIIEVVAPYP